MRSFGLYPPLLPGSEIEKRAFEDHKIVDLGRRGVVDKWAVREILRETRGDGHHHIQAEEAA